MEIKIKRFMRKIIEIYIPTKGGYILFFISSLGDLMVSYYRFFNCVQRFKILKKLIKRNNYKTFAEIGVWSGTTSKYLLKKCNLDKVICVDNYLPSFDMEGIGEPEEAKIKAKELIKNPKVTFLELSSEEANKKIDNNSIDIIFIDADHSYESAKRDIELWFPKVRKGGILCGHNYEIEFFGIIKAVNERFEHFRLDGIIWWVKK